MAQAYIGTSAFAEPAWRGGFYPAELPAGEYLGYYAARLSSVEVNTTFYGLPRAETLRRWTECVPAGFRFALKAPRRVTHEQPLERPEPLERFLRAAAALGANAGPLLFLLPPWLPAGRQRLATFLELLPRRCLAAFEFRHPSWQAPEIGQLLRERGAARCGTDAGPAPAEAQPGGGFVYLRLRRGGYTPRELEGWADRVAGWLARGLDVYCYFKHEETGSGPEYALALGERLALPARR